MTDRRIPAEASRRLGVFKRFADVPGRYRPETYATAYTERDVWAEYNEETGVFDVESDRVRQDRRRAAESWDDHMDDVGRHPALARPADVEAWCDALLSRMSARRAYNPYWVTVASFYRWLTVHTDHPHAFDPFVMAAAEYGDGAAGEIWDEKIGRAAFGNGGETA